MWFPKFFTTYGELKLISFRLNKLSRTLFTCVRNQAIRSLANDFESNHSDSHEKAVFFIDQVNPEEIMVGKELDDFIKETLDKLPPQCALVF